MEPSSKLVKWTRTYRDHVWSPHILERQQDVNEKNVLNKLVKQGPRDSLGKTNNVLKGYLIGLGYGKLSGVDRSELQNRLIMHMERKNLWKLGDNKAKFLSSRGSNKRKISKGPRKNSKKMPKVLKKKQTEAVSAKEK